MYVSVVSRIVSFFWVKKQFYWTESILGRVLLGWVLVTMKAIAYCLHNYKTHQSLLWPLMTHLHSLRFSAHLPRFSAVYVSLSEARKLNACLFHRTKLQFVSGCGLTPYIDNLFFLATHSALCGFTCLHNRHIGCGFSHISHNGSPPTKLLQQQSLNSHCPPPLLPVRLLWKLTLKYINYSPQSWHQESETFTI